MTVDGEDLALDATDLGLMLMYERRLRSADDAARDSITAVAKRSGISERTIKRHLRKWQRMGLWEKERTHRRDGSRGTDRLTRRGLTRAVNLIGENIAAGREPTARLPALLQQLTEDARGGSADSRKRAEAGHWTGRGLPGRPALAAP